MADAVEGALRDAAIGPVRVLRPDQAAEAPTPGGLVVSAVWPHRVSDAVIASAAAAWNVHGSVLPWLRGAHPEFWAIRADLDRAGVTVHALERGWDRGPVHATVGVPLRGDTLGGLCARLAEAARPLVRDLTRAWARGDAIPRVAQPQGAFPRAPAVTAADLAIDWTRPADDIDRLVRASDPWLCAVTRLRDTLVVVRRGAIAGPTALLPGAFVHRERATVVGTGDGRAYRIDRVEHLDGAEIITSLADDGCFSPVPPGM